MQKEKNLGVIAERLLNPKMATDTQGMTLHAMYEPVCCHVTHAQLASWGPQFAGSSSLGRYASS